MYIIAYFLNVCGENMEKQERVGMHELTIKDFLSRTVFLMFSFKKVGITPSKIVTNYE